MMTDPIADMLTRLRNGAQAHRTQIELPSSKLKKKVADILNTEGFVGKIDQIKTGKKEVLKIELRYDAKKRGVIAGIRRVSRPGLRIYTGHDNIPRVLNGMGIAILSTSKGVLSDKQCRKNRVGGEVLCYVW